MYEVLGKLPKHGIGAKVRRAKWQDDSFWEVTAVSVDMVSVAKGCIACGVRVCVRECMDDKRLRGCCVVGKVWYQPWAPDLERGAS